MSGEPRPTYAWHPDPAQFSYVIGSPCDSGLALYPPVSAVTIRYIHHQGA